ncbi:MAG: hypothetical protein ACKVQK_16575 [Burkholderiales bacterium]
MRYLTIVRLVGLSLVVLAQPGIAQLPIKQVVLYKHGVGYFERAGKLAAGEAARLEFKAAEMNDVLKSLLVTEAGGSGVRALRYDASDPIARTLGEFPFRIGERQSLASLIDQLKGARIELIVAGETIAGSILGARTVAATQAQPERDQLSVVTDVGDLRVLDLTAASRVRLADATLQKQLTAYLQALSQSRSNDKRVVYIDSAPGRARELNVGYVIPTPVWKSAYRLLFQASGQALLEGWAIVDNTTGEDWNEVSLSMVSGRPVSFISPLYEPRYISRPTVQLAEDRAVAPTVFSGALAIQGGATARGTAAAKPAARSPAAPAMALGLAAQEQRARLEQSSFDAVAEAGELGELFEYRVAAPVTIGKNQSAMLPFVQQRIGARKLSVYTNINAADQNAAHPMHAAELTNATGKTLDGGPITVYEGGAYGGEALVETLKAGDKRLIAYGVDLGTRVSTQFESGSEIVREIKMNRGVLTSSMAARETRTYTLANVDKTAKTLIIEQAARSGYTLVGRKADEQTANAYRFELKLSPDATQKFSVVEERTFATTTAVTNMPSDAIIAMVQNKTLSEGARRQLEQVVQSKQTIANLEARLRATDLEIQGINTDQERIRRNISSLNPVAGQQDVVQKYARQLAGQETQLAGLRDTRAELDRQAIAARHQLDKLIGALDF